MRPIAAGLALLAAGCATAPAPPRTEKVALLPMDNASVDVEAPAKVRACVAEGFQSRGFVVLDSAAVDVPLKGLGFTDGGQLAALKFDDLKRAVPADWYVYGAVKEFAFKSALALSQREVALSLKVVTSTGGVVFDGEDKSIQSKAGIDAAGDTVLNVAGKLVRGVKGAGDATDKVADVDLTEETRDAVRKLLDRIAPR